MSTECASFGGVVVMGGVVVSVDRRWRWWECKA